MQPMMRRLTTALALVALMVAAVPAASASSLDEVLLIDLVNQSRGEAGLAPLDPDLGLVIATRSHSTEMAAANELFHSTADQLGSSTTGWLVLGENVGRGPNARAIHDGFMDSEGHRSNILGDFDSVGVGTATNPDGTLFVTVIFKESTVAAADGDTSDPVKLVRSADEFVLARLESAAASVSG
jgi:uncharacterized protein YkwD